jgi:hypothetical protein
VISAHKLFAVASDSMAFRKSDGSLWIVPPAIALRALRLSTGCWYGINGSFKGNEQYAWIGASA